MSASRISTTEQGTTALVVAVGQVAVQAASLYAKHTARQVHMCENANALADIDAEVVVARAGDLCAETLDRLYSGERKCLAPGLILGASEVELVDCVKRLLARRSNRPHKLERISGHGDGVDALTDGGTILCAIKARKIELGPEPACCVATGSCFRLGKDLNQMQSAAEVRAASSVDADLLVMDVCNALSLNGQVDFQSSLASALLSDSKIQAAAMPWTTYVRVGDPFEVVLQHLQAGEQIGVAVARFNYSLGRANPGLRLAILGEPRARLFDQVTGARSPHHQPAHEVGYQAEQAAKDVAAADARAHLEPVQTSDMENVVEIIRSGGVFFHTWIRQCSGVAHIAAISCPYCDASSIVYGFDGSSGCSYPRQLLVCPNCSVVSDTTTDASLHIEYDNGHFIIHRSSGESCVIAIRLACKDHSLSKVWLLDCVTQQTLRFSLECSPPPGPLRLQVICGMRGQVQVAARTISRQIVEQVFATRSSDRSELVIL
jgi:hypothetical protein